MSDSVSHFPSPNDQDRILDEARKTVKKASFFMKKALDEDNLREGLRYARDVLGELRSSQLNPQKYYEMYMQVFDELTNLRVYIAEDLKRGKPFEVLYEVVQHAGNVLPRLYLMCTVGCEYIRAQKANPRDTLKDLVELCKGVQHPTRGLFLRSYLCQMSRGLLPDSGTDFEGDGGNIHDAMDFLLSNFIEMNKLWVRMQYQGSKFDLEKREDERRMLQDLVGKNLTYLSQLDGLDFNLYSSIVLKRVIDQISSCEDVIAQQYLMQCVIQCFPDEFHLGTLDDLLSAFPLLKAGVKVHIIMSSLIERLAVYAEDHPDAVKQGDSFKRLEGTCAEVVLHHPDMHAQEVIDMHKAMINFTGSVYPDRLDFVNGLMKACYKALTDRNTMNDPKSEGSLISLLSSPLSRYDVVQVLSLDSYPRLMDLLRVGKRKEMAVKILQAIADRETQVDSFENVQKLFKFIAPLIHDVQGFEEEQEEEDLADEQGLVARVIQALWSENTSEQFKILQEVGKQLEDGGFKRMKYTLPPLIFSGLKLVRCISEKDRDNGDLGNIFDWLVELCNQLIEVPEPMMALRCLLNCGFAASEEAGLEDTAYDCFEQACTLFEDSVSNSTAKGVALSSIISTLHRCHIFGEENRAALVHTVQGYCSQMLKKEEQCRAICMFSQLYWQSEVTDKKPFLNPPVRDSTSVMRSLKRCIKLADGAVRKSEIPRSMSMARTAKVPADPIGLYVELLNRYLYYFERGNKEITVNVIQQLLDLIANEMADRKVNEATDKYYRNTLQHITIKQGGEGNAQYAGIKVPSPPVQAH